jgi:hypothetical protein
MTSKRKKRPKPRAYRCEAEWCEKAHVHVTRDGAPLELIVIRGGAPYLWIGRDGEHVGVLQGKVALRKLGRALLREVRP